MAKLEHVDQQNNDATHEFTDGNDYMNEWCRHDIFPWENSNWWEKRPRKIEGDEEG